MKKLLLYAGWIGIILGMLAGLASAQTVPAFTQITPISVPLSDGSTTFENLTYGGTLGLAKDGQSLFYGCFNNNKFARISLTGVVLEPCFGPSVSGTGMDTFGGIVELPNGQRLVTGYYSYDAGKAVTKTLFFRTNGVWSGPFLLTNTATPALRNGQVAGYLTPIPQTLQAALGGSVMAGQGAISIISRSNYGTGAAAFTPTEADNTSVISLIEYPDEHQTWGNYRVATTDGYSGSESMGAGFFVNDTLFGIPWTQGQSECYGEVTTTRSMHKTANPAAGPGEVWCYDLSNNNKGPHGFWSPNGAASDGYTTYIEWYNVNDLKSVAAKTKNPWDVKPFSRTKLDGLSAISRLVQGGSAYDPVNGVLYATFYEDRGAPKVRRWTIGATPPPPPPPVEICGNGIDDNGDGQIDEGCAPPPPPVLPTGTFTNVPATCTITMTLNVTTGSVQFQRRLVGATAWSSHGNSDTAAPYTRAATVAAGQYEGQALWSGLSQPIPLGTQPCK